MKNDNYLGYVQQLSEIAEFINAKELLFDLCAIEQRANQPNADLIFPLVGEFSSGKTTLINALTDCKKLETATKPTTATIYEIHFGCEKCCATVYDADGNKTSLEDISSLKNDSLSDASIVEIFDTSKSVPATTVLVDTPGLSSPDPKHKQTLINFLPQADGILLVTDINQQITRSLTDFIEMMKLSKRPIYLVITKCDTKSPSEIEAAKQYISEHCKLPLQQMVCVSAHTNDLSEFYTLLDVIQKAKNTIIAQANTHRIKNIIKELSSRIEELLSSTNSEKELDEAIRRQEFELQRLKRSIEKLIDRSREEISESERITKRKFEDIVSVKLEALAAGKSDNFDSAAISLINNTSSLLLNEYKNNIKKALRKQAEQSRGTEDDVSLHAFADVDMSELSISEISYNLDLNSAGHQYDSVISTVTKLAVAATAVTTLALTAGRAAIGGSSLVRTATKTGTVIDVADTVSDVASIASNRKTARRVEQAISYANKANTQYSKIDSYNQQFGQNIGSKKGIVESMVGLATDKLIGKPQRKKAIHNYMDDILLPELKNEIERISEELIVRISNILHKEAESSMQQKSDALKTLKSERAEKMEVFNQRISQLKDYKHTLITL